VKADIVKETSAKDDNGISDLFNEVARRLIRKTKAKGVSILTFLIRDLPYF